MIAIHVHTGDTLSSIAAAQGVTLSALEAANPQIGNPNVISVGEAVNLSSGSSYTVHSQPKSYSSPSSESEHTSESSGSSGGLSDVPGVPSSFASCVAMRESTDGTNQAYNGGVYGIITASGVNVNGQSLSAQKAAFKEIYDTAGPKAWAADGCPGT